MFSKRKQAKPNAVSNEEALKIIMEHLEESQAQIKASLEGLNLIKDAGEEVLKASEELKAIADSLDDDLER